MSKDWAEDIHKMNTHYNFHEGMDNLSDRERKLYLDFRYNFIREECDELAHNIEYFDSEEIVDALIDIIAASIGTMDLFGIDANLAWDNVMKSNMNKISGVKRGRKNPSLFPDLKKPSDWIPPSHKGNNGILPSPPHKENE